MPIARRARALVAATVAATAACGPATFGGPPDAEIGTGATTFTAIADGATVPIARGTQGGYHVWGAVRARWLDPEGVTLLYTLAFDGDPVPITIRRDVVDLADAGGGHDFGTHAGTTVFLSDPDAVRGRRCRFSVELTDRLGRGATDARAIVPTGP